MFKGVDRSCLVATFFKRDGEMIVLSPPGSTSILISFPLMVVFKVNRCELMYSMVL